VPLLCPDRIQEKPWIAGTYGRVRGGGFVDHQEASMESEDQEKEDGAIKVVLEA
jgi:hypothetical protein